MPALRSTGRRPARVPAPALRVKLGRTRADGIAPSVFALLERGAKERPELAGRMRGKAVIRFIDGHEPVRVAFSRSVIRVSDGDVRSPDVVIGGKLPDVINLATTPLWRGLPKPTDRRGLRAIGRVARRKVQIEGDRGLARDLLTLLALR